MSFLPLPLLRDFFVTGLYLYSTWYSTVHCIALQCTVVALYAAEQYSQFRTMSYKIDLGKLISLIPRGENIILPQFDPQ